MPQNDRRSVARQTAQGLRAFAPQSGKTKALIGFDGFVDSIIAVVDKRLDAERYEALPTITAMGQRILAAAGKSANIELVVTLEKLGGNGPIMANAFVEAGLSVTYIGSVGRPAIHPVFESLSKRATVLGIAEPGRTDALEFTDGKLLLGKIESMKDVSWRGFESIVGEEALLNHFRGAKFIGMVNWTMLPHMGEIWKRMTQLLPTLGERKRVFVDLADPEKRTVSDLREALRQVSRMQEVAQVILGMNLKEAQQVAAALELPFDAKDLPGSAERIAGKLAIDTAVIHPREGASAARRSGTGYDTAAFAGPFVREPKLSTGAGDNFNAGFCVGTLAGLTLDQCLCCGTATSGYYVRHAGSPSLSQLAAFCDDLPEPQ